MTAVDDPAGTEGAIERGPDIERYHDLTLVGRGGSSRVFRAVDDDGALVAIKIFDPGDEAHYLRQVGAADRLGNVTGILGVVDRGRLDDGRCYVVSEFAAGGSLSDQLHATGSLSPERTARIGAQVARALAEVHRAGVLHRDIKPSNLLLVEPSEGPASPAGEAGASAVLLSDMGEATLTEPETASGTLSITVTYAAPEILEGADASERSDLYSLGLALQTLVTGSHPFGDGRDDGLATVINRICSEGLPDPEARGVPGGLSAVLRRACALDPEDRFADADGFARALDVVAADPTVVPDGVVLAAASPGVSPGRARSRRRTMTGVLAVMALVGAGAFGATRLTGSDELPRTAKGAIVAPANGVMTPMRLEKPNIFTSDLTRLCTPGRAGERWIAISLHANAVDESAGLKEPWRIINDGFGAFTSWMPCEVNDSQLRYLLFAPGLWFLTVIKFPAGQYERIRAYYNQNPPEYTLDEDMLATLKDPKAYAGYEAVTYKFG